VSIFGNFDLPVKTRVSLLEERIASYDEISKQMLSRLEQAVDKISESTREISQILIRHEERIDRASEANAAVIQLINKTENELKSDLIQKSKGIEDRVDKNTVDIEDLRKNKWIWVGIMAASSFFLGQLEVFDAIRESTPQRNESGYIRPM
jgi:seryl-tRNA synthetase